MNRNTVTKQYTNARAFWALALIIALAAGVYFYAINQTVRNVVERKQIREEIVALRGDIGNLEFRYIDAKNEITRDTARQLGFHQAEQPEYVRPTAIGRNTQDDRQL